MVQICIASGAAATLYKGAVSSSVGKEQIISNIYIKTRGRVDQALMPITAFLNHFPSWGM